MADGEIQAADREKIKLKKQGLFYGWYFKCQSDRQTLAVIPAIHYKGGKQTCSIQIITEQHTWMFEFPGEDFRQRGREISIGKNRFGEKGIRLSLHIPGLMIKGKLNFGALFPLKYDIMGPFSFVPFMECRHSVWSMKHSVWGKMYVNEKEYDFDRAYGYWEGDCGRSFPKEYVWTQCSFYGGALMLSVAEISLAGIRFRGVIGVVLWHGKEYRLATYLGAKVVRIRHGLVKVLQGGLELEAELLERGGKSLKAPIGGNMDRVIHENVACEARYRFRKGNYTIFDFETDRASFEYEYRV